MLNDFVIFALGVSYQQMEDTLPSSVKHADCTLFENITALCVDTYFSLTKY